MAPQLQQTKSFSSVDRRNDEHFLQVNKREFFPPDIVLSDFSYMTETQ